MLSASNLGWFGCRDASAVLIILSEDVDVKESVEDVKLKSEQLRGTLPEQLAQSTDGFDDAGKTLIKFHGIYQQEDRDTKRERKAAKLPPITFFMVRSKIPVGN